MNEERTPYLNLPLPHIDHLLQDDVERLRAALTLLDSGDPETMREAVRRLDDLGAAAASARARRLMRAQGVAAIPRGSVDFADEGAGRPLSRDAAASCLRPWSGFLRISEGFSSDFRTCNVW